MFLTTYLDSGFVPDRLQAFFPLLNFKPIRCSSQYVNAIRNQEQATARSMYLRLVDDALDLHLPTPTFQIVNRRREFVHFGEGAKDRDLVADWVMLVSLVQLAREARGSSQIFVGGHVTLSTFLYTP